MGMRAPAGPKYCVSQPRTIVTWAPKLSACFMHASALASKQGYQWNVTKSGRTLLAAIPCNTFCM